MVSFVTACAGLILLVAWFQNRKTPALGIRGLSHIVAAGGIFSLMVGTTLHLPLPPIVGAILISLSQGLLWKAARTIDAKPAPLPLTVIGMVIVIVANYAPAMESIAGSVPPTVGAIYIAAAAFSLWLGRAEHLPARWPLISFSAVHAIILTIGIYSFSNRTAGAGQVPSVMSLFGLVHFESVFFFVGTAAFLLSLVKERAETASRAAAHVDPPTAIAIRMAFVERAGHWEARSLRSSSRPRVSRRPRSPPTAFALPLRRTATS